MPESAYYLHNGTHRLFAVLHRPNRVPLGAILMCAPLGEEKLWSHRACVGAARELARIGYAVLRFDNRGEGDSDGAFEESSLGSRVEDACRALDELKSQVPHGVDLIAAGLRLGATVAALAAQSRNDVRRLVLWEPVINGREYLNAILRSNLMQQMAQHRRVLENRESLLKRLERGEYVNVEGYGLGGDLYRQLSELRLDRAPPPEGTRTLFVTISSPGSQALNRPAEPPVAWPDTQLQSATEEPFWREIRTFCRRPDQLLAITTGWLKS